MDKTGKKKGGAKAGFDAAIKGNEEIRTMRYHKMTFEELEEDLDTNIQDSKIVRMIFTKLCFRKGIDSR
jgi:hypothetical protein